MITPGDIYRSVDPRDEAVGRPHVRVVQVTPFGAGTATEGKATVVNVEGPERKRPIRLETFHEDERITRGPRAGDLRRSGLVLVQRAEGNTHG